MPQFTTDRFLLRSFTDEDLPLVHEGLSDSLVVQYYGISFRTLEDTKTQMKWFADIEREGTGQWFAITSLDGEKFYGGAGFSSVHKEFQKAEIGIWLLPDYWKRGIMREVFPPLCKWGFNNLNLFRIEAFVESKNVECIKAIEKVHFTYEGCMRAAEIKNGRYISLNIYSRLVMDEIMPKP